jgi:hypothetical protein
MYHALFYENQTSKEIEIGRLLQGGQIFIGHQGFHPSLKKNLLHF